MDNPAHPANAASGPQPLEGVRVVSSATNVPGPVALARLVALGAKALKVEPPAGDLAAPAWYDALRAGQQVVTLDLKRHEGRHIPSVR
jgi:crotonobetainyl-CoA:carnitine CoA-transferase CaiB-like acyl-CoA transferase